MSETEQGRLCGNASNLEMRGNLDHSVDMEVLSDELRDNLCLSRSWMFKAICEVRDQDVLRQIA
jgi:hypothetical protein